MTFIRTEINLVDFMLDRQATDVHVLITEQSTGGVATSFSLFFLGKMHLSKSKTLSGL